MSLRFTLFIVYDVYLFWMYTYMFDLKLFYTLQKFEQIILIIHQISLHTFICTPIYTYKHTQTHTHMVDILKIIFLTLFHYLISHKSPQCISCNIDNRNRPNTIVTNNYLSIKLNYTLITCYLFYSTL